MRYIKDISYDNVDLGIEQLENFKHEKYNDNTIYHVYWYGKLGRKQNLCIRSYLATQNLTNTVLWVWLDNDTYDLNTDLIHHKNIYYKRYNPNIEAIDTPFIDYKLLDQRMNLKFRSDIARILFLYKYGGIYFDLDMILLRDLNPLLQDEFCYSWSYLKKGNNGILRLKKGSILCKNIIQKYKSSPSPFYLHNQKFFLGYNHRYIFTEDIHILCYPCILFDPVWILLDKKIISKYSKLSNFDDFFKSTNEDVSTFFNNVIFAYHWHSRNNMTVERGSYFDKFEKLLQKKLLSK